MDETPSQRTTRRRMWIGAGAAAVLSGGLLAAIIAIGQGETTTINAKALHNDTYNLVDRAGDGEGFIITRCRPAGAPDCTAVDVAALGPLDTPPPTTTTTSSTTSTTSTTTIPPTGEGYPSIPTAQISYQADLDPVCALVGGDGGFVNKYEEGTTWQIQRGGAAQGECWAKATANGTGKLRAELGTGVLPEGVEFTEEFAVTIPSGVSAVGFTNQLKQDEDAGSCANGGFSYPTDSGHLEFKQRASCNSSYQILDFGVPPKDHWFCLRANVKVAESGGFAHASLDPDCTGPQPYGAVKSFSGDTSSGGNVKPRVGSYGNGLNPGQSIGIDGYYRK